MEVTKNVKFLPAGTTQYLVDGKDDIINVDTSTSAVNIVLPNIQNAGFFGSGKCIVINDYSGNAGTNNITLGAVNNTVNSAATVVISSDGGSAKVSIASLTEWFAIIEPSSSVSPTTVFFVDITYAALAALKASGSLVPGRFYKITDRADLGIALQALSVNTLSFNGNGIYLNPDFQDVGDYSGTPITKTTNQGVWVLADEASYTLGNIVFYGGLMYQLTTPASKNGSDPANNPAAYTELSKSSTNGYIEETDSVLYDFDSDIVKQRVDIRLNEMNQYSIATFQWGNDRVLSNQCFNYGIFDCINQRGTVIGNQVQSSLLTITDANVGTIRLNNISNNTYITADFNTGKSLEKCQISWDQIIYGFVVLNPASTYISKRMESGFSDFSEDLDMTSAFSAGTLTIPISYNYVGIINLTNNSGQTITKITNVFSNFARTFTVQPGNTQIFSHTTVGSAVLDELVSDAATTNTITGRTNGTDFIQYQRSGNLNVRTNIVQLA